MSDFDDDLKKQRRNLLLISIALLIFDFADVSIAKVGILGTDLIVGNPTVLVGTAWLFWLYFLLRYFQYWRVHNARSISTAYFHYLSSWGQSYVTKNYNNKAHNPTISMRYVGLRRFRVVERKANTSAGMDESIVESIPLFRTLGVKLKATWHVAVVSPHFTDQMFPFVIAALAPIVTAATRWQEFKAFVA